MTRQLLSRLVRGTVVPTRLSILPVFEKPFSRTTVAVVFRQQSGILGVHLKVPRHTPTVVLQLLSVQLVLVVTPQRPVMSRPSQHPNVWDRAALIVLTYLRHPFR